MTRTIIIHICQPDPPYTEQLQWAVYSQCLKMYKKKKSNVYLSREDQEHKYEFILFNCTDSYLKPLEIKNCHCCNGLYLTKFRLNKPIPH